MTFQVGAAGDLVTISYTASTNAVDVQVEGAPPPPGTTVALVGSLQSELGCPGDWQPECAATELTLGTDGVWRGDFTVPAGSWEYKVALNDTWDVNYGAGAVANGGNIALTLAAETGVRFYFDDTTHWVTSNRNVTIATAAGSFQSEIGCPGDWAPDCLRSWLQDIDGNGVYTFVTDDIPAGAYAFKAALDEGWTTSYPGGRRAVLGRGRRHRHVHLRVRDQRRHGRSRGRAARPGGRGTGPSLAARRPDRRGLLFRPA